MQSNISKYISSLSNYLIVYPVYSLDAEILCNREGIAARGTGSQWAGEMTSDQELTILI